MKKVLSLFLALIMILSICTVGVSAFEFYDPPICIATYPYHVRKGDVVYYPYEFKNKGKDFYKLCEDEGIENGKVTLRFRYSYDAESIELVDVYPTKELYEAGGTAKIIERYTDEESYSYKDFYVVEVTFDLTYGVDGKYLFNTCFNVLEENFYDMGISTHLIGDKAYYEAGENYEEYKDILCEVTDENGQVHDMSKYFTWSAIIIDDNFDSYDDLLIKNYEPFIPPVSSSDYVWISASRYGAKVDNYLYFPVFYDDDQSYARCVDENSKTKITFPFFYDPEILKPVEVTPSEMLYGMNFTGEISKIDVYTQINRFDKEITYPYFYADVTFDGGTEIEKGDILFNVKLEIIGETASNDGGYLFDSYFIVEDLENSVRTCAKWEITDGNGMATDLSSAIQHNYRPYPGETEDYLTLKGYEPFIPPVENIKPLFNFGVTEKHIQKKYDMVYYPATFDFTMYDDANIRYLGVCQEVANVEFGSETKVIAKYIYDATTLKFIEVYTNGFDSTVKVLEQGSTGETGPDGQEYNYIVVQADFLTINYSNESGPYYLKFSVLEDNFINEDGTVRTVVDNAPYEAAPGEQLFVWEVTDADGVAQNIGDRVKFNSVSLEAGPYTYEDLILKDNLNEVNMYIGNDISAAHARVDNFAYYPCKFMTRRSYADLIRSLTGFEDGSTQVQFIMSYDSSTLELIDALPSKELYDIGGTATIIENGDLNYEEDPYRRYAIVQIDFEGFADIENGYLFTLKFNVLKENFIDENGRALDLVNFESFTDEATYVASCFWKVTDNQGKSYDINWYVFNGHMDVDSLETYSDLIIEDYEPFDPTLLSDVTEVTYVQTEDTRKTFTVKADGRKSMIQFIEPDGGTRTYDRYNKNVSITSYDSNGNVVSTLSRDLAYEVWEIYSNMSVGVEINVRGKENGVWDEVKYTFTIEPYNPVDSMELSATAGKKGAVPATVVADEKTEKVMFKMPNNTSVTVSNYTTDENGNRVFTGKAWMNEDGLNEIRVYIRRDNVWKLVGTLEYTVK